MLVRRVNSSPTTFSPIISQTCRKFSTLSFPTYDIRQSRASSKRIYRIRKPDTAIYRQQKPGTTISNLTHTVNMSRRLLKEEQDNTATAQSRLPLRNSLPPSLPSLLTRPNLFFHIPQPRCTFRTEYPTRHASPLFIIPSAADMRLCIFNPYKERAVEE